jgi:hypothetical protein
MGSLLSLFSKSNKDKILSDNDFTKILDELNIKDAILNDTEITNENLIEKIFSAIETKYKFNKNTKRKKYTTDIINDLNNFKDKISGFKNKFIETNQDLYSFILSELMKLEKIIIDLQDFLGNIPNNAPNSTNFKRKNMETNTAAASSAATPAANSAANNAAAAAAAAKKEANNAATPGANPEANPEANHEANYEANPEANSGANDVVKSEANSGANSVVKSEANSGPTPNLKKVNNISADPKEIFKLIQDFESKFFNNFFTKVKKGKIYKNEAKNDTKQEHIFNFLKVLLLYKKLFPNEEKDYIDELIKKYSSLCPKVGDEKCGLTKEKNSIFGKKNTYNSNSQKIKELGRNIENKTSKNFIGMLDEIIPTSNANKKIENENMKKIESKIQYFINRALRLKYFSDENGNKILKKYLDFIKFLLLFKKIMKNKYIYKDYSSSIDSLIKQYLRECSLKEAINESVNERLKKCKSSKTQLNSGSWKYELINSDPEFIELLQDGWKNDEEFNKLRDEFNTMLDKYYTIFKVPEDERVKLLSANQSANQSAN